jgi:hypothetical protein
MDFETGEEMELVDIRYALTRIQMEYIEMPEMRLSRAQVRRLLNLPSESCDVALAALVQSGFLVQSNDGAFLRGASARAWSRDRYDERLAPAV